MINPEEGGNTPLRHVGYYLRANVALYARRIGSSLTPIWKSRTLNSWRRLLSISRRNRLKISGKFPIAEISEKVW